MILRLLIAAIALSTLTTATGQPSPYIFVLGVGQDAGFHRLAAMSPAACWPGRCVAAAGTDGHCSH